MRCEKPRQSKGVCAAQTAADLRELLTQSIIEIRSGKLDPRLANSISLSRHMGWLFGVRTMKAKCGGCRTEVSFRFVSPPGC